MLTTTRSLPLPVLTSSKNAFGLLRHRFCDRREDCDYCAPLVLYGDLVLLQFPIWQFVGPGA